MGNLDEAILTAVAEWRSPLLTRVLMDIGSLGSPIVISLISTFAFTVLWTTRNRGGALKVVIAAGGAELWMEILKRLIQRPRPMIVPYLVGFSGFSFPSGHAMTAAATYTMIAAVVSAHAQSQKAKTAIWFLCI